MSKICTINKDLLSARETYIVQQVSCYGNMNRGIPLQVKNKYPDVYRRYQNYCDEHCIRNLIGRVLLIPTEDGKIICNLFTPDEYRLNQEYSYMDILKDCFCKLIKIVPIYEQIAMPYMIGCENEKNDWKTICELIQHEFKKHTVVFYKS